MYKFESSFLQSLLLQPFSLTKLTNFSKLLGGGLKTPAPFPTGLSYLARPKPDLNENENSRSYQSLHLKFFSHINYIFLTMINEMSFPSFFKPVQI